MTGTVELDADGAHLVIRFPYREDLVAQVKELPGRRWDPKHKQWRVPCSQVEHVYALFSRHLFEFAPEVTGLLAGTIAQPPSARQRSAGEKQARSDAAAAAAEDAAPATIGDDAAAPVGSGARAAPEALSISAFNELVRDALRQRFPQRLWLVGEVLDYDKQADRAHRFFTLVEKAPSLGKVTARVEAALFERTLRELLPRLQQKAPDFRLCDGIEVRVLVRVDFYAQTGRFQVIVEDVDPTFTLGKLALAREEILRTLREKGLADRNRMLALPMPPLRIGVLTSPDSDGWNDFLRQLQESGIGFDVTLVPVSVQGRELRPSMLAGLRWFDARAEDFDVLCIVRGGGSRTDLAWFDDLHVALAVAEHPLKILVGVGHQRDQCVLDAIAHSEKTPTAVAAFLVQCAQEARQTTREAGDRLQAAVRSLLGDARDHLAALARDVRHASAHRLHRERAFVAHCARQLHGAALLRLERGRSHLHSVALRATRGAERRLERAAMQLDHQAARQRLLDPRRVIARGFALLRGDDGRVLPAAGRVRAGQVLTIELRDGRVRARADAVQLDADGSQDA